VVQSPEKTSGGAKQPSFVVIYWRLLGTLRPYLSQLVAALMCMIALAATTGIYAYMVGPLLKFLITRGEHGGFEILSMVPGLNVDQLDRESVLAFLPLVILGVALIKGISYFGQFYLMGMVGQRVVADLRDRMFARLTSLSPAYFQRTPTGQILSRFTNDVYAIEQAVTYTIATYLRDGLQVLVLMVLAFILDWQLALITFVVMPLAVFPIVHFGKRLKQVSLESQSSLGNIADRLHETIRGMRIIQVFNAEQFERERFHLENRGYFRIMHRSFMVRALQSPVMEFLGAFGLAATIWYAGSRMTSGSLDPGHFVSFFAAVLMLYNPTKSLGRIGDLAAAGVAAAERVFTILDEPDEIKDRSDARALQKFEREIVFENVRFSYGSVEVLKGVSFSARRGEVLAIVGASGAGKSTLVNLIPRFFDVTDGRIAIDGIDIRDLQLRSLRGMLGMVTQEVLLFNDSVAGNLAYGLRHVDGARLREVAQRAHALEFIEALPQGFETRIGEGGIKLSGGQRQRIAIARALMRNAPILILDEATSSLDSESEREVQDALEVLMRDRTTVVIAHRLSTIRRADRILVLDSGRIVESGNHEELLNRGGIYRRLYDLQFEESREPAEDGLMS
jgi:subfamily B ATP-binding cassette protein MsbA